MEGGVIKLLNRLDRARFQPFLVALRGGDKSVAPLLAPDIPFIRLAKKEGRDWSVVSHLAKVFDDHRIDIVHSHNWETWLYCFLAAKRAHVPVFIHGEHGRDTQEVADSWKVTTVKKLLAQRCERLTTVSQDIAELMMMRWKSQPDKITVIPNGIDLTRFCLPASREAAKAKIGVDKKCFLVGTVVGTFRPVKDLPALIHAFVLLRRKYSTMRLMIVGGKSGEDTATQTLKRQAEQNGVGDAVFFPGPRQEIEQFMQAMDVYTNSSVYEGMSNTLLEAMGCGAAIVATKVGGTPMIVRDGYSGLLVSPQSPEAMAAAIGRLTESPHWRMELLEHGRKYVAANHNQENFFVQHQDLYQAEYLKKKRHVRNLRIYHSRP